MTLNRKGVLPAMTTPFDAAQAATLFAVATAPAGRP